MSVAGLGMEQELGPGPVFSYEYYQSLESRSRKWADAQALDPSWMGRDEYGVEYEMVGYCVEVCFRKLGGQGLSSTIIPTK